MLKKFILLIIGIIIAFILSIAIDRVLGVVLPKRLYFKAMIPGLTEIYHTKEFDAVLKISAQGLRNPIVPVPKPENNYRILALGDSFTLGFGVDNEDTWARKLEGSLSLPGKKVEVINAGVSGMDLEAEIDVCKAYLPLFDPDMVLLAFYSTDDFYQSAARDSETTLKGRALSFLWPTLSRMNDPILDYQFEDNLKENSTVNHAPLWQKNANIVIAQNPGLLRRINPSILPEVREGKINPALIKFASLDPSYWIRLLDKNDFILAKKAVDGRFARLKKDCTANIPVAVVFLPSSEMVSLEYLNYRKLLGFDTDDGITRFDIDTPLMEIVKKYGFSYFSLLSAFRQDGCPGCYYPWDSHLTPAGNLRIANYLKSQLKL